MYINPWILYLHVHSFSILIHVQEYICNFWNFLFIFCLYVFISISFYTIHILQFFDTLLLILFRKFYIFSFLFYHLTAFLSLLCYYCCCYYFSTILYFVMMWSCVCELNCLSVCLCWLLGYMVHVLLLDLKAFYYFILNKYISVWFCFRFYIYFIFIVWRFEMLNFYLRFPPTKIPISHIVL